MQPYPVYERTLTEIRISDPLNYLTSLCSIMLKFFLELLVWMYTRQHVHLLGFVLDTMLSGMNQSVPPFMAIGHQLGSTVYYYYLFKFDCAETYNSC